MDHPSLRRWSRSPAFTLIELAAVAVCVALLALLLQPSLSEALGGSRRLTCLARMQKIGEASLAYSQFDPTQAALPVHRWQNRQPPTNPSFIGAYEWGGKSGVGQDDFISRWASHPYFGSRYGTPAGFGPARRPLNKFLYPSGFPDYGSVLENTFTDSNRTGAQFDHRLELDAFRCPGDDGPPLAAHCRDWVNTPRQTSFDHFGTSFAANIFMTGRGGAVASISPYLRPLSDVPNPGRTLAYEENIGRWAWSAQNDLQECWEVIGGKGVGLGSSKTLRGWHRKDWTYNRSFIDGHAETQTIYREGTEDANGYALHYRNEQLPCYPTFHCDGNGIPGKCLSDGFELWRCVIVRGDGWQKDTLPAQPVCTGLYYLCPGRRSYECCVFSD